MPDERKRRRSDLFRFLGIASTVGINMVVSTFAGFAIGYWILDKYFGTFPWFTGIFLLLGIISGFRYLIRVARKAGKG
jgi:ATP synthase protein I